MADVSIVIPVYNEESNIPFLVDSIVQYCASQKWHFEIIFVDDGSDDDSAARLKQANLKGIQSKLVRLTNNCGSHNALRAGICNASGEFTCFLSADLQEPMELVGRMAEIAREETVGVVWAARIDTKYSLLEDFFSKCYASLVRMSISKQFSAKGYDVVLFTSEVKQELIKAMAIDSSIFVQILLLTKNHATVTYTKTPRAHGKSKWTFRKRINLFISTFVTFSRLPCAAFSMAGLLACALGSLILLIELYSFFSHEPLMDHWKMVWATLLLGFGITVTGLALIADYLRRVLDSIRSKTPFEIEEVIDLSG